MTTGRSDAPDGESRTFAEAMRGIEGYAHSSPIEAYGTVAVSELLQIFACIREQQAALRDALPYIESQSGAEHMLDGFGPRTEQPADAALNQVRAVLEKWEMK